MPSKEVFFKIVASGIDVLSGDSSRYSKNDTLASAEDLIALYDTLYRFKDRNGKHPKVTALTVVANPDFDKIRQTNFENYFYEPFTETLKRYPGRESSFDLWKEGISKNLFVPEFHAREHYGVKFQAAFDVSEPEEIAHQNVILKDGLELFNSLFGFRASYFVPPNGPINNTLEAVMAKNGIKYMCSAKVQYEALGRGKKRKVFHYLGQRNGYGQLYITRNCFFEPSQTGTSSVDSCLRDMSIAFAMNKPAIISSHRVNYIGAIDESNRANGLGCLNSLLNATLQKWPSVEFMTTAELGDLINKGYA
jgi:hypothetical protein